MPRSAKKETSSLQCNGSTLSSTGLRSLLAMVFATQKHICRCEFCAFVEVSRICIANSLLTFVHVLFYVLSIDFNERQQATWIWNGHWKRNGFGCSAFWRGCWRRWRFCLLRRLRLPGHVGFGVCARVWSVLMRTETAARSLVLAQVFVEAKRRGVTSDQMSNLARPALGDPAVFFDSDDVAPLAVVHQRLKALQCLLNNLPRRGEALLRRLTRPLAETSDTVLAWFHAVEINTRTVANQWRAPGPWHPPERMLHHIRL